MTKKDTYKAVLVVGIIGSGKTSLCKELGDALNAIVFTEQAQENGNPFLPLFYEDMERWAFTLQMYQLGIRFSQHDMAQCWVAAERGNAVIDGGFWLDVCFSRMIRKAKLMTDDEFEAYRRTFKHMTRFVQHPNVIIRLSTSPSVALKRIASRAEKHEERRSEVGKVTLDYLESLDDEIVVMCQELQASGVTVIDSHWDENRDTPEQRQQAVSGLARRVLQARSPDPFTAHWQRRLE